MKGKINKGKTLRVIGYILLIFWVIFAAVQFNLESYAASLWFCNISIIILSLACFSRSLNLIYFVLAVGIFFQTPWILDWLLFIISGYSIFDLPGVYEGFPIYFMILTFVRHTLAVPLAIGLLFLLKPVKPGKRIFYLFTGAIFLLFVLSYFSLNDGNINCVRSFCAPGFSEIITGFSYTFVWFALVCTISLISLRFVVYPLHVWIQRSRKV